MKLFLPQAALEEWMMNEKADLQDGKLVVKEGGSSTHPAAPAVHFVRVVSGEDTNGLVNRVKTTLQIHALGGEHLADSVIMGDSAYEVVEGYLTEVQAPGPVKADPKKKVSNPEADLLAAFILDKL